MNEEDPGYKAALFLMGPLGAGAIWIGSALVGAGTDIESAELIGLAAGWFVAGLVWASDGTLHGILWTLAFSVGGIALVEWFV